MQYLFWFHYGRIAGKILIIMFSLPLDGHLVLRGFWTHLGLKVQIACGRIYKALKKVTNQLNVFYAMYVQEKWPC